MFKKMKAVKDMVEKTGCTKKQASYLYDRLSEMPEIKNVVMQHMSELNLKDCKNVDIDGIDGFENEMVLLTAERDEVGRLTTKMCFYTFDINKPDYIGIQVV